MITTAGRIMHVLRGTWTPRTVPEIAAAAALQPATVAPVIERLVEAGQLEYVEIKVGSWRVPAFRAGRVA